MTEKNIKRQIVNAAEAVKRKVRKMRNIETEKSYILDSFFKPVIKPLNQMISKEFKAATNQPSFDTSSPFDKTLKRRVSSSVGFSPQNRDTNESDNFKSSESEDDDRQDESFKTGTSDLSYENEVSSWSLNSEVNIDVPFGVRNERGKLMMGSARVLIFDNDIQVGTNKFKKTPGLDELLFKKVPDLSTITDEDLRHYKLLLLETNVHRRDYDPHKPIRSNRGRKYLHIIKPLFKLRKISASTDSSQPNIHGGEGLPILKKWKKNVDYVYWDDPNELVDRLKLLIASRDAGNTGLDNEIISIVEELRESGIISNK